MSCPGVTCRIFLKCRIAKYMDGDIDFDTETLESIRAWMIKQLLTFKKVFPSRFEKAIKGLQV